jgi:hypothetical protein
MKKQVKKMIEQQEKQMAGNFSKIESVILGFKDHKRFRSLAALSTLLTVVLDVSQLGRNVGLADT